MHLSLAPQFLHFTGVMLLPNMTLLIPDNIAAYLWGLYVKGARRAERARFCYNMTPDFVIYHLEFENSTEN